ncbi:AlkZ-related protein [Eubacteriales bacterium SGI.150]
MSAEALKTYLNMAGILSCNVNPYLPALDDIGCTWADAVALIDTHEVFYCKNYRKRTIYLSPEVYYLLKACRTQRPMTDQAALLYALLEQSHGIETGELRENSLLGQKDFVKAMDFLLEQRYITAIANGTWLNLNWSTYRYGTARAWEGLAPQPPEGSGDPAARLNAILSRSLPDGEIGRLK